MALHYSLFSGPLNATMLIFFMAVRQQLFVRVLDPHLLWAALTATAIASVFGFLLIQLLRITRKRVEVPQWNGPERVLLFPCRTSHSRLFPRKHSFSYPYLTVGIPVGFEGNAGGMVSVEANGEPDRSSWLSPALGMSKAWFTIDPGDYLERGKLELSLRGKLDEYLRTQCADPASYPYAYLVTAARFLGYHFNPVSFWYLYDADKRLSAMVLEVNNTFDERRMYFLTSDNGQGGQNDGQSDIQAEQSKCSSHPGPRQPVFTQSWPKDFHVSPFSSRKGSYTVTASDPLALSPHGAGPLSITITLLSSKGHPKVVASLSSAGPALDPYTRTTYQKLRFLASWWYVGFLTFPRICVQAARLFFQHRLHVWYRPEPLKDTISRRPTQTEQLLEPIFRRYLKHLLNRTSTPLCVTYTAPDGMGQPAGGYLMLSPSAREMQQQKIPAGIESFKLTVLTPAFYTAFVHHTNTFGAFASELDESRTVWASSRDLLRGLSSSELVGSTCEPGETDGGVCFTLIRYLRAGPREVAQSLWRKMVASIGDGTSLGGEGKAEASGAGCGCDDGKEQGLSDLDAYVLEYEDEKAREVYCRCVLRVLLAERVAFGSLGVLGAELVVVQACVAWALASVLLSAVGR